MTTCGNGSVPRGTRRLAQTVAFRVIGAVGLAVVITWSLRARDEAGTMTRTRKTSAAVMTREEVEMRERLMAWRDMVTWDKVS